MDSAAAVAVAAAPATVDTLLPSLNTIVAAVSGIQERK